MLKPENNHTYDLIINFESIHDFCNYFFHLSTLNMVILYIYLFLNKNIYDAGLETLTPK